MEYFRRCKENLMLMTSPSSNHRNGDHQCQLKGKRIMWICGEKKLVRCSVLFSGQNEAVFRLHMDEWQLFYFLIGKSWIFHKLECIYNRTQYFSPSPKLYATTISAIAQLLPPFGLLSWWTGGWVGEVLRWWTAGWVGEMVRWWAGEYSAAGGRMVGARKVEPGKPLSTCSSGESTTNFFMHWTCH